MPTLKHLTCHVKWEDSKEALKEYRTNYADGRVDCYLAIPNSPTVFYIEVTNDSYIAPGLAVFAYIDGVYQCNRNRRGLEISDGKDLNYLSRANFILSQKEEFRPDGTLWGKKWRFDKVNAVGRSDTGSSDTQGPLVGTIEVVVLRCYKDTDDESLWASLKIPEPFVQRSRAANKANAEQQRWFGGLDGAKEDEVPRRTASAMSDRNAREKAKRKEEEIGVSGQNQRRPIARFGFDGGDDWGTAAGGQRKSFSQDQGGRPAVASSAAGRVLSGLGGGQPGVYKPGTDGKWGAEMQNLTDSAPGEQSATAGSHNHVVHTQSAHQARPPASSGAAPAFNNPKWSQLNSSAAQTSNVSPTNQEHLNTAAPTNTSFLAQGRGEWKPQQWNVPIQEPTDTHPKPYWTGWKADEISVPSTHAGAGRPHMESPPLRVSREVAEKNLLTNQMTTAIPRPFSHRLAKPKYMDTLEKPYAVFTFKYRNVATVELMFGIKIDDSKAKATEAVNEMSREEMVEKLKHALSTPEGTAALGLGEAPTEPQAPLVHTNADAQVVNTRGDARQDHGQQEHTHAVKQARNRLAPDAEAAALAAYNRWVASYKRGSDTSHPHAQPGTKQAPKPNVGVGLANSNSCENNSNNDNNNSSSNAQSDETNNNNGGWRNDTSGDAWGKNDTNDTSNTGWGRNDAQQSDTGATPDVTNWEDTAGSGDTAWNTDNQGANDASWGQTWNSQNTQLEGSNGDQHSGDASGWSQEPKDSQNTSPWNTGGDNNQKQPSEGDKSRKQGGSTVGSKTQTPLHKGDDSWKRSFMELHKNQPRDRSTNGAAIDDAPDATTNTPPRGRTGYSGLRSNDASSRQTMHPSPSRLSDDWNAQGETTTEVVAQVVNEQQAADDAGKLAGSSEPMPGSFGAVMGESNTATAKPAVVSQPLPKSRGEPQMVASLDRHKRYDSRASKKSSNDGSRYYGKPYAGSRRASRSATIEAVRDQDDKVNTTRGDLSPGGLFQRSELYKGFPLMRAPGQSRTSELQKGLPSQRATKEVHKHASNSNSSPGTLSSQGQVPVPAQDQDRNHRTIGDARKSDDTSFAVSGTGSGADARTGGNVGGGPISFGHSSDSGQPGGGDAVDSDNTDAFATGGADWSADGDFGAKNDTVDALAANGDDWNGDRAGRQDNNGLEDTFAPQEQQGSWAAGVAW